MLRYYGYEKEAYSLLTGDLLLTKIGMTDNQLVVTDIFNINGCPINKFNKDRNNYYLSSHVTPETNMVFQNDKFNGLNIKFGENVYMYGNNNMKNTEILTEMINSSNAEKKIYINTTIVEKNRHYLNDLKDVEIFATDITEDVNITKRLIFIAAERAKRLYEMDQSVIIAVDDVASLALTGDDLSCARNVMSLTKNNKGSISVLAIMSKDNKFNMFERLADKRLNIENEHIFLIC